MNPENFDQLRRILIADEGLRLRAYKCPAGKLTIGVGRNIEDNGITRATAMQMLDEDIVNCIDTAHRIFGAPFFDALSPARQHAIVSMIFNLGESRFREFYATIRAIRAQEWATAAEQALASKWARQVGERARRIAQLFTAEQYDPRYK